MKEVIRMSKIPIEARSKSELAFKPGGLFVEHPAAWVGPIGPIRYR
jgi:hypothetical protein